MARRHGASLVAWMLAWWLLAASASACFVGYDSRWGEAKRAQRSVAAQATPEMIHRTGDGRAAPDARVKTRRVRLRPSAQYLSQIVDAPKQIADLLDDANAILGPDVAVRLEADRVEPWSFRDDEHIEAALSALVHDDAGEDVDWVVGMVGGIGRQTESLHVSGYAELLGKHLVVRAASQLGERDAIESSLPSLGEDERARLLRARKRHRALAVFLHELGHSLGALHEDDPASLMNPAYATERTRFGAGAISLMRVALDGSDPTAIAGAQLAILRSATTAWVPADRDAEIARLQAIVAAAAAATSSGRAASAATPESPAAPFDVPPVLAGDDRDRFERAVSFLKGGAVQSAYETARPLFGRYPGVYAVQDLRCQLATVRWLERSALLAECAPLIRLSGSSAAGRAAR